MTTLHLVWTLWNNGFFNNWNNGFYLRTRPSDTSDRGTVTSTVGRLGIESINGALRNIRNSIDREGSCGAGDMCMCMCMHMYTRGMRSRVWVARRRRRGVPRRQEGAALYLITPSHTAPLHTGADEILCAPAWCHCTTCPHPVSIQIYLSPPQWQISHVELLSPKRCLLPPSQESHAPILAS